MILTSPSLESISSSNFLPDTLPGCRVSACCRLRQTKAVHVFMLLQAPCGIIRTSASGTFDQIEIPKQKSRFKWSYCYQRFRLSDNNYCSRLCVTLTVTRSEVHQNGGKEAKLSHHHPRTDQPTHRSLTPSPGLRHP